MASSLRELGDQSPVTGYVALVVILAGPLVVLEACRTQVITLGVSAALFCWLLTASLTLGAVDYFANRKQLQQSISKKRLLSACIRPAVARWLGSMLLFAGAWGMYGQLGIYLDDRYQEFQRFFVVAWQLWALLGLPYYLLVLPQRHGLRWDRRDPVVLLLCILRRVYYFLSRSKPSYTQLSLLSWGHHHARIAWLGLLIKGFFLPLMLTFFISNSHDAYQALVQLLQSTADAILTKQYAPVYNHLFTFTYHGLFLIDVALATIGYYFTSRVLGNGIISAESTGMGWLSCIACYQPWNTVTGWYLRWPTQNIVGLPDGGAKYCLMIAIILLIGIYVWATLAFGLRFSNLTYRGLIVTGPYRWCRHPAYISKNLSWWLEYLPSFTHFASIFGMLGWTAIYTIRALTEERHLKQATAKYQQYCKLVRYRFIPGLC